mmetsp:Transcript_15717/g.34082  ORF Transcript_15717/g.34082 Transcript_15717/m.34082 type:complete len:319 (+) Transcript_15717:1097-2053(+)
MRGRNELAMREEKGSAGICLLHVHEHIPMVAAKGFGLSKEEQVDHIVHFLRVGRPIKYARRRSSVRQLGLQGSCKNGRGAVEVMREAEAAVVGKKIAHMAGHLPSRIETHADTPAPVCVPTANGSPLPVELSRALETHHLDATSAHGPLDTRVRLCKRRLVRLAPLDAGSDKRAGVSLQFILAVLQQRPLVLVHRRLEHVGHLVLGRLTAGDQGLHVAVVLLLHPTFRKCILCDSLEIGATLQDGDHLLSTLRPRPVQGGAPSALRYVRVRELNRRISLGVEQQLNDTRLDPCVTACGCGEGGEARAHSLRVDVGTVL